MAVVPWMSGVVTGVGVVALLPALPPPALWLALAPAVLLPLALRRRTALFCAGLAAGVLVAGWQGQQLLRARLAPACVGLELAAQGVIASLPQRRLMPDGTPRQRFDFDV